jgi:hypothetical protein
MVYSDWILARWMYRTNSFQTLHKTLRRLNIKAHAVATWRHTVVTLTVIAHTTPTFMSEFQELAGQCTGLYQVCCATLQNEATHNCRLKDELEGIRVERCIYSKVTEFRLHRQISRMWVGTTVIAPARSLVDWHHLQAPHFTVHCQ